jgi:hypothetical protein
VWKQRETQRPRFPHSLSLVCLLVAPFKCALCRTQLLSFCRGGNCALWSENDNIAATLSQMEDDLLGICMYKLCEKYFGKEKLDCIRTIMVEDREKWSEVMCNFNVLCRGTFIWYRVYLCGDVTNLFLGNNTITINFESWWT